MAKVPIKDAWVIQNPPAAKGRYDVLLGMAFENPLLATRGEYTPQFRTVDGLEPARLDATDEPDDTYRELPGTYPPTPPSRASGAGASPTVQSTTRTLPVSANSSLGIDKCTAEELNDAYLYTKPCRYPKEMVTGLYSGEPVSMTGVEAIVAGNKDFALVAQIKRALSIGAGTSEGKLDSTTIPHMTRYMMESPRTQIRNLLNIEAYRHRVLSLLKITANSDREDPCVYIATKLYTCAGISRELLDKTTKEVEAGIADPSGYTGVKFNGKKSWMTSDMLKGTLETEVVLAISYHRLAYEQPTGGAFTSLSTLTKAFHTKYPRGSFEPIRVEVSPGARTQHTFYVSKFEEKGTAKFFGPRKDDTSSEKVFVSEDKWHFVDDDPTPEEDEKVTAALYERFSEDTTSAASPH